MRRSPEPAEAVRADTFTTSSTRISVLYWTLLVAVLAIAALLRSLHLGDKSFWMDEGVSFAINRLSWIDFLKISWRRELNMAPYYLLLRGWMKFGTGEAFLRSLSVLFSVAAVAVIYLLGRRLFGLRAGLLAALLAAVHAFLVRYAQEARSYSLVIFLVSLSCLLFVRNLESRERTWTAYIVITALAIYGHFFALLVVLSQWISLQLLPRPLHSQPWRAWKITAIAILPLIVFIATRGAGPIAWISRPNSSSLHSFLVAFTGNGGDVLLAAYMILTAAAVIILVIRRAELRIHRHLWGMAFVLSWLLVPILVTLVFSLARPVFLPRYLVICVPALVLLAAAVLVRLSSRWLQAAAVLLLAWFSLQGVRSYYRADFDIAREDWRDATHYVLSQALPGDGVVFHAALGRMPFEYYVSQEKSEATRPDIAFPRSGPAITYSDFVANAKNASVGALADRYSRVWLVLAHNEIAGRPDDTARKLETDLATRFPCIEQREFPQIVVRLYFRGSCPHPER